MWTSSIASKESFPLEVGIGSLPSIVRAVANAADSG